MISSKDREIISIKYLRDIFEEMKKYDITKLVINRGEARYEIQRGKTLEETFLQREEAQNLPSEKTKEILTSPETEKSKNEEIQVSSIEKENVIEIKTPIVGTFYRAPSPESQPFVDLGSQVKKGDVLCIVEAMKSMNEIESDVDGIVQEILVENGKMVEYDQPMFRIKINT
jgi:acetyl-CoA carboxylase biotin carboxyl carrier protein